jgi:hypothetical protein
MRVLVCGGRHYSDALGVFRVLDALPDGPLTIINGGAPGADALARRWAERSHVEVRTFPADWSVGRSAGPRRNQRMIDEGMPDLVIAFPGGRGTADMVRRARAAGIRVREIRAKDSRP